MRIFVKAKPNSKENKVVPPEQSLFLDENKKVEYVVYVKAPPKEGKANDAIIKVVAEYFKVSRSQVVLLSGTNSKQKVFEIN